MADFALLAERGVSPTPMPGARRICPARRARGRMSQAAGVAAEGIVERHYLARGLETAARRWRGGPGELDLVLRDGARLVFVEIKQAPSFERAAERLGTPQIRRLQGTIDCFLEGEPLGGLTDVRFDIALVNGAGEVRIIENALAG